jgi:hypothetical protein
VGGAHAGCSAVAAPSLKNAPGHKTEALQKLRRRRRHHQLVKVIEKLPVKRFGIFGTHDQQQNHRSK